MGFSYFIILFLQVELYISGQSIKVMCALVLHLVPAWPDDVGESTVTFDSVYFKPPVSGNYINNLLQIFGTSSVLHVYFA